MTIRLETLGRLAVFRDESELTGLPAQPIRCGLFAFLAVERRATRDQLLALFWPERDADAARHALSQTLYRLRQDLGGEWLDTQGDQFAVSPGVEADVHAFAEAVGRGDHRHALSMHGGPFLGGIYLVNTSAFETWVEHKRSEINGLYLKANRGCIEAEVRSRNLTVAIQVARRWVAFDPLHEEAQRTLIQLLADSGQRLGALQQYEKYEKLLADELEIEPLPGTKELIARIRRGESVGTPSAAVDRTQTAAPNVPRRDSPAERGAPLRHDTVIPESIAAVLSDRYRIERVLGRGGMATVYLAEDLRHPRKVAVKVLHPEVASAVAPERFLREIEITAALSHPHIVAVHDSGQVDDIPYYVMPHVEGESLRARLSREGRLPYRDAIRIIREIADALAYAHDRGVVHRDIKPDNVMLSGRHAFVTDFGVAKAMSTTSGRANLTAVNMTVGTPAYMAPEQAAGVSDVDHRADIYALGTVAYEVLTGQLPFQASSPEEALEARISKDPTPLSRHRPDVPPDIEGIVMKCLRRSPAERWQSITEVVDALESHITPGSGTHTARRRGARFRYAVTAGGLSLVGAALVVLLVLLQSEGGTTPPTATFRQLTFSGDVVSAAISPDGRYVAYVRGPRSSRSLMVRQLTSAEPVQLASQADIASAQWHPSGQELLFQVAATGNPASGTWAVPLLGGQPRRVSDAPHAVLSPDGSKLAAFEYGWKRIVVEDLTGNAPRTVPLAGSFTWLSGVNWSPNGRLLTLITGDPEQQRSELWTLNLRGERQQRVLTDSIYIGSTQWAPQGDALYYVRPSAVSGSGMYALWRMPINQRTGASSGNLELVLSGLEIAEWSLGEAGVSLTPDGRKFVYVRENRRANLVALALDETRQAYVTTGELTMGTSYRARPTISPDERWVAYSDGDLVVRNIFKMPVVGGPPQQLTFDSANFDAPVWSPAGDVLAFSGTRPGGGATVWTVPAQGGTVRQFRATRVSPNSRLAWAPGDRILYQRPDNRNFHLLDVSTEQERPLVSNDSVGWMFDPHYAPDGKRVAVFWNRKDRSQTGIWLVSLEDSSQTLLMPGANQIAIGWTQDGAGVAVRDYPVGTDIHVISVDGRARRLVGRLPPGCADVAVFADLRQLVCERLENLRDAWLVENFDPRATAGG